MMPLPIEEILFSPLPLPHLLSPFKVVLSSVSLCIAVPSPQKKLEKGHLWFTFAHCVWRPCDFSQNVWKMIWLGVTRRSLHHVNEDFYGFRTCHQNMAGNQKIITFFIQTTIWMQLFSSRDFIVSFTAVIRVVTRHATLLPTEEWRVTTLIMVAKETKDFSEKKRN